METPGQDQRRSAERRLMVATVVAGVLAVVCVTWLAALTEPGNGAGVVMLEAMTAVPLLLVLRWRRRLGRTLATLPQPPRPEPPRPGPIGAPLRFDPAAPPQLVLRPRLGWRVVVVLLPLSFMAFMVRLAYEIGVFDPRILLIAAQAAWFIVIAWRSQIVVADGALWRRSISRYQGVDLGSLETVEIRRARYLKQEGPIRTLLRVQDRGGRSVMLKPVLWSRGARPVLAGIGAIARQQGVPLDFRTAAALDAAAASEPFQIWASAIAEQPAIAEDSRLRRRSTFWVRRDEDGMPKKAQPQVLLVVVAALAVMVPSMVIVGRVGTDRLRSVRCNRDRHLWTTDVPPKTGRHGTPLETVQRLSAEAFGPSGPVSYTLASSDLANHDNSEAVQSDASRLQQGYLLQWRGPPQRDVYIEQFDTRASAERFQRDYAEDHCHQGDTAFAARTVPGAVGFRCPCEGEVVNDRVSFVQGDLRVQVIAWNLPSDDDHEQALRMADRALRALIPG